MTWTQDDERILNEMMERKQAHEQTLHAHIEHAVDNYLCLCTMCHDAAVQDLIENATQIRKVLEPFDKEFKNA